MVELACRQHSRHTAPRGAPRCQNLFPRGALAGIQPGTTRTLAGGTRSGGMMRMKRRDFLKASSATLAAFALQASAFAREKEQIDAAWYRRSRRFAELPVCRVAYVERGRGAAALFVSGCSLNGFQWRGEVEGLHERRMGIGQ